MEGPEWVSLTNWHPASPAEALRLSTLATFPQFVLVLSIFFCLCLLVPSRLKDKATMQNAGCSFRTRLRRVSAAKEKGAALNMKPLAMSPAMCSNRYTL
jgi:hypothetical protein